MKKKPLIYLEFTFRYPEVGERRFCPSVSVPVLRAWQEDPNDLHIALDTPDGKEGLFVQPEVDKKSGDYALPFDPWLGREDEFLLRRLYKWFPDGQESLSHHAALACTMEWVPRPSHKSIIAPPAYVRLLEAHWYSPNR
jgi:hypothetical protein